jgi:hypothetical protein
VNDLKYFPAPSEIMHFDDSLPESEPVIDIFYRWRATIKDMAIHVSVFCNVYIQSKSVTPLPQGQIPHCIPECPGIYNVNSDIEHYCTCCKCWFHIKCIKRGRRQTTPTLSDILTFQLSPHPKDLLRILMVPIERGGIFGLSGNGQIQLRVRREVQNSEGFNLGWIDGMDSSYMEQVQQTDFTYFGCPSCVAVI